MMMVSNSPPVKLPGHNRRVDGARCVSHANTRPAFSLVELMVVLSVVVLLTSLLLPALGHVREHARRVVCSSNLHNLGVASQSYFDDWNWYPPSVFGVPGSEIFAPQEMMAARREGGTRAPGGGWDGLGLLFAGKYCAAPNCFYCPSHTGDHQFERYENLFYWPGDEAIWANYQYAGHLEWPDSVNGNHGNHGKPMAARKRIPGLKDGNEAVLVADGLRSPSDFNHRVGTNVLRADISVRWLEDASGDITSRLEEIAGSGGDPTATIFAEIWGELTDPDAVTAETSGGGSGHMLSHGF